MTRPGGNTRRILYVITDLDVGGVPLHLARLAAHVHGQGWTVLVASLKPPGPVARHLEKDGIELLSCNARGPADWRVFDHLSGIVAEYAPHLIHSLLFHANLAARYACVFSGFPPGRLLCEIQTAEIERGWHLLLERLTCRWCRCIIGNSPSVVRHVHERGGVPMEKLRLVPGGVDARAVQSAEPLDRATFGVTDQRALLLWAGRMDPVKGLDTLIEAVDILRRSIPVKLLLAGDGDYRLQVESEVVRRGIAESVCLIGRRDDVHRLMRTADLFVFPSRTEGMPNALLEAMAASLPVVTTDVPGCRDLVTDGVTGRLVPPDDPRALAAAMTRALNEVEESRSMAARAADLVSREYSQDRCFAGYMAIYLDEMDVSE